MVLHFENSFVTLAVAEENSRRDPVVETLSPFSGMRRISSKDKMKMNNSYTFDTTDGTGTDKIKRVSSVSSISNLGKFVRYKKIF